MPQFTKVTVAFKVPSIKAGKSFCHHGLSYSSSRHSFLSTTKMTKTWIMETTDSETAIEELHDCINVEVMEDFGIELLSTTTEPCN